MASDLAKWWNERPGWQQAAMVVGGVGVVAATGGAAAYAIAAYGATASVVTAGGTTVSVAVGKAVLEGAKALAKAKKG